jgi:GTPase Era involved in 16S rRNA processing
MLLFLGYKVDKNGLHIPDERIKSINNVAITKNTQDVKAFLGLVNYYDKFVENMSTICNDMRLSIHIFLKKLYVRLNNYNNQYTLNIRISHKY